MVARPLPDYRCRQCHTLLFRGILVGEIQCGKCCALNTLDICRKDRTFLEELSVRLQVVLQLPTACCPEGL